MPTRHDAFISYSHRADGRLAKAIEDGIEGLAKPLLRLRACDVFRDETSLSANPSLWAGILDHLSGSANRITFSPKGLRLAASYGGGSVPLVWDLDVSTMRRWACQLANRDLTAAEWRELAGPLPQPKICPLIDTPAQRKR